MNNNIGIRMVQQQKGWAGGVTCKCGSSNVRIKTYINNDKKHTVLECQDCGNRAIWR